MTSTLATDNWFQIIVAIYFLDGKTGGSSIVLSLENKADVVIKRMSNSLMFAITIALLIFILSFHLFWIVQNTSVIFGSDGLAFCNVINQNNTRENQIYNESNYPSYNLVCFVDFTLKLSSFLSILLIL